MRKATLNKTQLIYNKQPVLLPVFVYLSSSFLLPCPCSDLLSLAAPAWGWHLASNLPSCRPVLESELPHPHFTRFQRARGVMETNTRNMFDEELKRLNGMESRSSERWERWEKRLSDSDAERKERDDAVDERLQSLENFASAQYNTAAVADNWGSHFEDRLQDLEHRQTDLELIHIHEIRDEHDDWVEAVESEVKDLMAWCPLVDGSIDYLGTEVKRLSRHWDRALVDPSLPKAGIMSTNCLRLRLYITDPCFSLAEATWDTSCLAVCCIAYQHT